MKKVEAYETEDGQVFADPAEALEHERAKKGWDTLRELIEREFSLMNPSADDIVRDLVSCVHEFKKVIDDYYPGSRVEDETFLRETRETVDHMLDCLRDKLNSKDMLLTRAEELLAEIDGRLAPKARKS